MLATAGISSVPTSWSLQSHGGVFSVNLSWSSAPESGCYSSLQQAAPKVITRKTPSMLRRDRKRQEEHRRKQQNSVISSVQNFEVCGETFSTSIPTCDSSSQTDSKEMLNNSTQTGTTTYVEKSVQSFPNTSSVYIQTEPIVQSEKVPNHQSNDAIQYTKVTEKVLKRRIKGQIVEYLIKWRNLPPTKNTWVSVDHLDSVALNFIYSEKDHLIPGPARPKLLEPVHQSVPNDCDCERCVTDVPGLEVYYETDSSSESETEYEPVKGLDIVDDIPPALFKHIAGVSKTGFWQDMKYCRTVYLKNSRTVNVPLKNFPDNIRQIFNIN